MKVALLGIAVVVLMGISGAVGYYFGNDNGLKSATNIQREFFSQRFGQGAQSGDPNATGQSAQQGQTGQRGNNGQFAQGGRPTASGTIKSVQGNTITVTQQDGSTTNVTVNDKATIQKTVNGTLSDVQPGWRITVIEPQGNSGGTQRIQLTQGQ